MIGKAAYGLYAARGFGDGGDLDDWLQAETLIDRMTSSPDGSAPVDDAAESGAPD
jgi:hypothetical protein